ncbi:MAG TPA: hypothetical protein VFP91_02575 [Vicinamibacterales bacterium]|nr:hypothetical protein [Vicinamibacterales bacterium]
MAIQKADVGPNDVLPAPTSERRWFGVFSADTPNAQSQKNTSAGFGFPTCGKYGSDHFIHVRSIGGDTTGVWKSTNLR